MLIRYKVVKKETRASCAVESIKGYKLFYKEGALVKAKPNTLGIFCFKTYRQAKNFINRRFPFNCNEFEILRVIPIGRAIKPKRIVHSCEIDAFYQNHSIDIITFNSKILPLGTVCYPAVQVID